MTSPRAVDAGNPRAALDWALDVPISRGFRLSRRADGTVRELGISISTLRGVLAQLAKLAHFGYSGYGPYPAQESYIAQLQDLNVRTVRFAIRCLREQGLIEVLTVGSGRGTSSYRITFRPFGCRLHRETHADCLLCRRRHPHLRQKRSSETGFTNPGTPGSRTTQPIGETYTPPVRPPTAASGRGLQTQQGGPAAPDSSPAAPKPVRGCKRHRRPRQGCKHCAPTLTPARYVAPGPSSADHAAGAELVRAAWQNARARSTASHEKRSAGCR